MWFFCVGGVWWLFNLVLFEVLCSLLWVLGLMVRLVAGLCLCGWCIWFALCGGVGFRCCLIVCGLALYWWVLLGFVLLRCFGYWRAELVLVGLFWFAVGLKLVGYCYLLLVE